MTTNRSLSIKSIMVAGLSALALVSLFQNCANTRVEFSEAPPASLGVCEGISCELTPLTDKPAVTTILMALGDEADSQLVVNGASAQLIAETVIRYTSPKPQPKILVIKDNGSGPESAEDTAYVTDVLLKRYQVTLRPEPATGLTASDFVGFDVVWFNNPGTRMASSTSRDALLNFAGAVVLQGDDLSQGAGFDNSALTGLLAVDNGTSVDCGETTFPHDNNAGYQYRVRLDPEKIPGAEDSVIEFNYGNDIDLTRVLRPDLQVLAWARGGHESCIEERPAIVRYLK